MTLEEIEKRIIVLQLEANRLIATWKAIQSDIALYQKERERLNETRKP